MMGMTQGKDYEPIKGMNLVPGMILIHGTTDTELFISSLKPGKDVHHTEMWFFFNTANTKSSPRRMTITNSRLFRVKIVNHTLANGNPDDCHL